MRAFIEHFVFDFKAGLRDKSLLLINYLFPLGFYVMMGFIMPQINPLFKESMIPSMAIFSVIASSILGMPNPLVAARESGIFRSYKINGVPAPSILTIPAIATIIHSTIVGIIIVVTAPILFDGKLPENLGAFALVFFATEIACAGLGILIGVIAANNKVTILWSQLIFLPSMLIGGLMMPSSMLPSSVSRFGRLLPSTYAMSAFDSLVTGRESLISSTWCLGILIFGGIMGFIMSVYLFKWDNYNSSKNRKPILAVLALIPYVMGIFM